MRRRFSSEEARKYGLQSKGRIPWNKGLKIDLGGYRFPKGNQLAKNGIGFKESRHTEETKKRISRTLLAKNGRTEPIQRQERNDPAYHEWRKNVRNRDNWKCKIADKNCQGKVVAHHILPWSKFPELRYEVNNGITLCRFHHPRKRNDEMRLSPYFQSLVVAKAQ